jgi:hypothetical protein
MAIMGKYCKAYPIKRLREFSQWTERSGNTRKEKQDIEGTEVEVNRTLTEDDFLYLQENYVVTDGIFKDEHIIFDQVTSEWKDFCHTVLRFEIPDYAPEPVESNTTARQGNPQ